MKMNECTSRTWKKVAEIPTDDFSIEGITEAINDEFGELFFDDILEAIADGADGIISKNVSVPVMVKHEYRDIKIDASTTVTIDLEDIKKQLAEDFYRSQGIGIMLGG